MPQRKSIILDGVNGRVDFGGDRTLIPATFTFAGWVKVGAPLTNYTYLLDTSGGHRRIAELKTATGMGIWDGAHRELPTFFPADGQWHHVAWEFRDAGDLCEIFLDGVSIGAVTYTRFDSAYILAFGRQNTGVYLQGQIADFRIYSDAIGGANIASLAHGGEVSQSLIGHWEFTEGGGSVAADTAGTADGTLAGGFTWSTELPQQLATLPVTAGLVVDIDPHAEAFSDLAGTTPATVGGLVGNVPDQTGQGAAAIAPATGSRPTLTLDGNGWRRLTLDGIQSQLLSYFSLENPFTVVVVGQAEVEKFLIDGLAAINTASFYAVNDVSMRWYSGSAGRELTATIGTLQTYLGLADGLTKIARIESVEDSITAGNISNPNGFMLGTNATSKAERFTTGTIYRLIAYNRALTQSERAALTDYLDTLYAHPPGWSPSIGSLRLTTRSPLRLSARL